MSDLLHLEPVGGVAGDMFLAAALDLGLDRAALEKALATLEVPGFELLVTRAEAMGVAGTHLDVRVSGHGPHHRALSEILALVRASGLPPRARDAALALFECIGRAEALVHGIPFEEVCFHEVGAVDSIVDLCGAAVVLELLGWPRVVAEPPELGQGFVTTCHGRLPVPAPAVLEILKGRAIRPGGPPGEAVTPTGAAILATLCEVGEPPPFTPRRIGYGVGTSRWPDRPNVLRLTLGEVGEGGGRAAPSRARAGEGRTDGGGAPGEDAAPEGAPGAGAAGVWQLEANLDDCPGELVARAVEAALEAGALDVWATPCTMKKGRPGLVVGALAPGERREQVARALLLETTTLGVRHFPVERLELDRRHDRVETRYGPVEVKVGLLDGAVVNSHPEYEACAALARRHGVPVKEVLAAASAAWRAAGDR